MHYCIQQYTVVLKLLVCPFSACRCLQVPHARAGVRCLHRAPGRRQRRRRRRQRWQRRGSSGTSSSGSTTVNTQPTSRRRHRFGTGIATSNTSTSAGRGSRSNSRRNRGRHCCRRRRATIGTIGRETRGRGRGRRGGRSRGTSGGNRVGVPGLPPPSVGGEPQTAVCACDCALHTCAGRVAASEGRGGAAKGRTHLPAAYILCARWGALAADGWGA